MAKRSPKPASSGTVAATPRQHSMVWLQGLLCGAMAMLAPPTALLLGVLLGPAVLALMLDRQPGRPRARSIALFGMAASVDPLRTLWVSGHAMTDAAALLGDLHVLGIAAAAAAGWLLAEAAPVAVRATLEALTISRTARLRALRSRLSEEWRLDPPAAEP
jgi:membrane-associated phospholipid phosphatase